MVLKKIYNNNIVLCVDENGEDAILIGLGIAFHKTVGQPIDEEKIERKFILDSKEIVNKYNNMLKNIPIKYLEITNMIVKKAQDDLNTTFQDDVYIAIGDHINYAIKRHEEGNNLKNALLWEIKKYYRNEFKAAKKSLMIIKRETGIELEDDEAGFIALHFVNAQKESLGMSDTIRQVKMVESIMKFACYQLHYVPDENDINYQRFLTHLRFLIQRITDNEMETLEDNSLYDMVKEKYQKEFRCSKMIGNFVQKNYHYSLSNNEVTYLTLHLHRMLSRNN